MPNLKEILKGEDTLKIDRKLAEAMLDRYNRRRHSVDENVLGKWSIEEVKYFSYDPEEKPEAKDFAIVTLKQGSKIIRLPLSAITGAMVVAKEDFGGSEPYVQGKEIYRTSNLEVSDAVQYLDLMEGKTVMLPNRVNVIGIEVLENRMTMDVIVQSRFYLYYPPWAREVHEKTGSYPSIFDFQAELQKPADKRHESIPADMKELTLVPGVDAKHPKVEHCATRLYIADAVD